MLKRFNNTALLILITLITVSCFEVEIGKLPYSVNIMFFGDSTHVETKDSIALWIMTQEDFSSTSYRIENNVEQSNDVIDIDLIRLYTEGIAMNCEYGPLREYIPIIVEGDEDIYYLNIYTNSKKNRAKIVYHDDMIVLTAINENTACFQQDTLFFIGE